MIGSVKILKEADYIAQTSGKRNFHWRYFVISTEDSQLIENTMSYRLAEKNILEDTSWIKPGLASWEWWNGATPYGPDVNFVAGAISILTNILLILLLIMVYHILLWTRAGL